MANPQKAVELFHLLFLRHISGKLDKGLYAVKGGCNLRFFFKSIRYSEDLDIDVKTIAKETLGNKIEKLLSSQSFQQALAARGMAIDRLTAPKQTETTQRWKMGLKLSNTPVILSTKIEFSRRNMDGACLFEPVDSELIQSYQLYPILTNHYTQESAFCQKVSALIHRTEVQARDLFDLHLLLDRGVQSECLPEPLRKELDVAIEHALSIDFSAFKAQVVAYLMDEYQDYYGSAQIWNQMQSKVVSLLENIR